MYAQGSSGALVQPNEARSMKRYICTRSKEFSWLISLKVCVSCSTSNLFSTFRSDQTKQARVLHDNRRSQSLKDLRRCRNFGYSIILRLDAFHLVKEVFGTLRVVVPSSIPSHGFPLRGFRSSPLRQRP